MNYIRVVPIVNYCSPALQTLRILYFIQEQHYLELKQRVLYYDMLIDKLITKDVQLTACNDDQYFVFEDVLHQVLISLHL